MDDIFMWLFTLTIVLWTMVCIRSLPSWMGEIVRPTAGVAVVLVIGTILFVFTGQGRELVEGISDVKLISISFISFLAGLLFWSQLTCSWSRILIRPINPDGLSILRERPSLVFWLPYFYELYVYVLAAIALLLSLMRSKDMHVMIALLAVVALTVVRIAVDIREWNVAKSDTSWIRMNQYYQERCRRRNVIPSFISVLQRSSIIRFLTFWIAVVYFVQYALWDPVATGFGSLAITLYALGFWTIIVGLIALVGRGTNKRVPTLAAVICIIMLTDFFFGDKFHSFDTFGYVDAASGKTRLETNLDRQTVAEATKHFGQHVAAKGDRAVPIVFVATAGGGIRAAYWTAIVLSRLSDSSDLRGFSDRLFAISSVSGGSLGAAFVEALIATRQRRGSLPNGGGFESNAKELLRHDFLGPTILRIAFTEPAMPLSRPLGFSDRGKALELAWSAAWRDTFPSFRNPLDEPFLNLWADVPQDRWRPILLLNATHEEQGKRIITSNVKVTEGPFIDAWDMHELLEGRDLRASAAAHNSARFSWVSPPGTIIDSDGSSRGHVLDGGYFENYGAVTLLEVARATLLGLGSVPELRGRKLLPVIIQISSDPELPARDQPRAGEIGCESEDSYLQFDDDHDPNSIWGIFNDILAPIGGIYTTRSARGILASKELAIWVECRAKSEVGVKPTFIHLAMCSDARPPLGWVMSQKSREEIDDLLSETGCNGGQLAKLKQVWSEAQAANAGAQQVRDANRTP